MQSNRFQANFLSKDSMSESSHVMQNSYIKFFYEHSESENQELVRVEKLIT